jgi:hypothetical protein
MIDNLILMDKLIHIFVSEKMNFIVLFFIMLLKKLFESEIMRKKNKNSFVTIIHISILMLY